MLKSDIFVGQILRLRSSKFGNPLVKVVKVNPKNIKVIAEDGGRYNCSPGLLLPTEPWDTFSPTPASAESTPRLTLGSVVRFKIKTDVKYPLLVVVGSHKGTWRLAPLGGDDGRYYRGICAEQIEVVNFEMEGV